MNIRTTVAVLLLSASIVSGCAQAQYNGEQSAATGFPGAPGGSTGPDNVVSAPLPTDSFTPVAAEPAPGGTFVGTRVTQLRADLDALDRALENDRAQFQQIKNSIAGKGQTYHATVAGIQGRLQAGSTPGNPQLVSEWNRAQTQLGTIDADIARLNELSTKVGNDGSMSGYLLDAVRSAYGLSGAVEEDHRQLRRLEERASRTGLGMSRLQVDVGNEISRQIGLVNSERNNLQTLASLIQQGDIYNPQMRERLYTAPALSERPRGGTANPFLGATPASAATPGLRNERPLVVIRFDAPNVMYEQPLYQAISRAIEQRPNANFDVVAVTPSGTAGRGEAERVYRSMNAMGVPADRMRLSSAASDEVRANEVHIYVR